MNPKMHAKAAYIGDPNQLMSCFEGRLSGGKQDGVRFIQISNGNGFELTLLPDRCLDIYQLRFRGLNVNYISPVGAVAPSYYDRQDIQFLRSFFVGFLTTCGLQNIGGFGVCEGEGQGLHGRISNTPASDCHVRRDWSDGRASIVVTAEMREARLFAENLVLRREIRVFHDTNRFEITDSIRNDAFTARPFVYALHMNYGYPLLEEGTRLLIDSEKLVPRDAEAAKYADSWQTVEAPSAPYTERCYFHQIRPDKAGKRSYALFNEKRKIGVRVSYPAADFPDFCQWKMLGSGEYVMGLEPLAYNLDAPKPGAENCAAPLLQPAETRSFTLTVEGLDELPK